MTDLTQNESQIPRTAPGVRHFGRFNWLGLYTLYQKEVQRFLKIFGQTIAAPAVNSLLFLVIFTMAIGKYRPDIGGVPFAQFMAPGLIMMTILQNSFANTSSSLLGSKIQGNMVDFLMPPLSPGELGTAFALGGITRGVIVAFFTTLAVLPIVSLPIAHIWAILFYAIGAACMLSLIGIAAGIWAEKWDHMSTVVSFIITPLSFLSGTFYSVSRLPDPWFQISQFNPFFYMIDGFRYGFTGVAESNLVTGAMIIISFNLALWFGVLALLRSGYKLKA
jgi:ABC-2 type transport system permease protein